MVALRIFARCAAALDLIHAVTQCIDQGPAPLGVIQQIILQVRVTLHDPHVTQNLVQHTSGPARTALLPKLIERVPRGLTQQADDDLVIRERRVVVRDFTQPRSLGCGRR